MESRSSVLKRTVACSLVIASFAMVGFAYGQITPVSPGRDDNTIQPVPPVSGGGGEIVPLAAGDGSWNVNADGNWSLATNWLSSAIADGAGATGNFTFNITAGRTITIDTTPRTLGIMNIGDSTGGPSNYTITASSGATLTFDNTPNSANAQLNQTSTSGNNTISAPVSLTRSLTVSNASANNLTISGAISGAGGISHTSGLLTLTAVNSYAGNTTISGGRISIDGDATLGNGSGTLFLSGGTFSTSVTRSVTTDPVANNITLTADSAITTTSSAATVSLSLTGTLSGSAGTLTFRNDGTSSPGLFDPRFAGGTFTTSRPIVIDNGAGGGTTRLGDFNASGTTHQYDGVISGNGSFNRSSSSGVAGLTVFTAANTYTGPTTINNSTLQLGNGGATGSLSTSSAISTSGGSTFKINRSNAVAQGTDFSGAAITGTGKFEQAGAGTTTLNIANTYSGGTTISGGTLIASADGALGSGNVSLTATTVTLTLQSGATNNYISNNASIDIVSGGAVANLNFTGLSDVVGGITLGGVLQTDPGTYGSTASGAAHPFDAFFTGTGTLDLVLVPEPSTWAMICVGAALLGGVQRFRRKRS